MKKDIIMFKIAEIILCISALSILLVFFANYSGNVFNIITAYLMGVVFWGGLIAGYVLLFIVNKHRKQKSSSQKAEKKPKFGIITFFSNKPAIIADVVMCLSLVLTIVFTFVHVLNDGLWTVFGSIFLCAIHLHIIFNGANFKYIKSIENKGE